ncbi:FUN14 domain-containing protein [Nitratifractor sp.]|uniref:FUN14 domain-containing protein n=1 Tax=Nitratifractor sp. TaxID=2268144 RepID=UPI002600B839|nr:FUN14 domain-containing protein [Nitratifractor sp.]
MDENLTQTITDKLPGLPWLEMGSGFLMGLAVGYFLKKSFKILLLLMGLTITVLFVLENQHIVSINESGLSHTVSQGSELFKQFADFLKARLSRLNIAGGASAVAGFFAGLKMG